MMSRFFNTAKDWVTPIDLLKAYNALTAASVLYVYLNDPKASRSEFLFDVSVHLLQIVVTPNSYLATKLASLSGNAARMTSIVCHFLRSDSTIPPLANAIDFIVNHPLNFARNFRDIGYDNIKSAFRTYALASG